MADDRYDNGLTQLVVYQCHECHSVFLFSTDREQHTCITGHSDFEETNIDEYELR
jgi:hypothetical protein